MFGMLDYRAHKLYLILFGIPSYIIRLLTLFILPFICYYSGSYFSNLINLGEYFSSTIVAIISLIICTIISVFFVESIWLLFILAIGKIFKFIFELIIDVIPADGRTKEEAEIVLYAGNKGITQIKMGKHPKNWDDELILNAVKLDWVASLFYREEIMDRTRIIKEYFVDNPEEPWQLWKVDEIIEDNKIELSFIERWVSNNDYRSATIRYLFILILIILNPIN
jgi:Zn-dependent protease with chaperone function